MPDASEDRQMRERLRRIDTLLSEVENFKDPAAEARTRDIVQCLMDLHGEVFNRLLQQIADSPTAGVDLIHKVAQDDLVAGLMLLYGLHPLDLETRVGAALDKVRPYLHSHGGNVELLGIENGVVRLRLQGSCHGCPSSAMTLKTTIEEAILEKAPDAAGIEVEGEETVADVSHNGQEHNRHFALPILAG